MNVNTQSSVLFSQSSALTGVGMRIQDIQVLVAEGTPAEAGQVKRFLREMGLLSVDTVTDGYSALIALKKQAADLLLLDWHLPKMGGEDVLRQLRAIPRFRLPKVIAMVNGGDDRNLYQKGTDLGVATYLVRPFAASILQERIEKEMNQRIL